jgi:hypothetical protein
MLDLNHFTRKPDHSLDQLAVRVARILKDDNVSSLGLAQSIAKLVHHQELLVFQRGSHTVAYHFIVLEKEETNKEIYQ